MAFSGSPRLLKGGIVVVDPLSGAVQRIITLQYNPETLTRTLAPQTLAAEGERSEPMRLKGPPVETYKLDAEIDAADQLEFPDQNRTTAEYGVAPQLAVLESLLYPTSEQLIRNNSLASSGTLEIIPMEAPLTLFVWSKNRVLPVRITEFSVTEEAFDPNLNPLRAKVSLGLRVLSVTDLGFDHLGGNLALKNHQQLERLASLVRSGSFGELGIQGIG